MLTPALVPSARRARRWRWPWGLFASMRDPLSSAPGETVRWGPSPASGGAPTRVTLLEFERFFLEHQARVSGFLWRMTGDTQAASDLSQETFLRAWQRFEQISAYERPDAWLIHVATNLALQHRRRRRAPIGAAAPLDEAFDAGVSDPGQRFPTRDVVRETLAELPPRARALLVLREVYGFSGEEAATALGMTPNAAKVALFRARQRFRAAYLAKEGTR